jgi:hypothetical protein
MTKDELIAKQQLEIEEFKEWFKENGETLSDVCGMLYNVGAPLNGNKLGMSREQLNFLVELNGLITSMN